MPTRSRARGSTPLRSPASLRPGPRFDQTLLRETVGLFVQVVAGVSAHPVPPHLMRLEGGVEPLPEIDILDGLAVGRAPAVAFPLVDPAGDAAAQILTV